MQKRTNKIILNINNHLSEIEIKYSKRKSVGIKITPEGQVVVHAPFRADIKTLEKIVASKASWIEKALKNLEELEVLSVKRIVEKNDFIPIMGIYYPFEVQIGNRNTCTFENDTFQITTDNKETDTMVLSIESYLKDFAEQVMREMVVKHAELINVTPHKLIVKTQKKRWGTCSSKGEIRLNWKCIMLPKDLIEYIVIHELCHLNQMNHSSRFWSEVEKILPDYKVRRAHLKRYIISLD